MAKGTGTMQELPVETEEQKPPEAEAQEQEGAKAAEREAADDARRDKETREEVGKLLEKARSRKPDGTLPKKRGRPPKKKPEPAPEVEAETETQEEEKPEAEPEGEPAEREDWESEATDRAEPEKPEKQGKPDSEPFAPSAELKARAESLGVPEDKLKAMGSEISAEILLSSLEQQAGAALLKASKKETTEEPPPEEEAKPEPKPAAPKKPADATATLDIDWGSEDDAMEIPDVVKKHVGELHSANKALRDELDTLRRENAQYGESVQSIQRRIQAAENAYAEAETDRFIADLGEDWEPVFGKGPMSEVDPETPEGKAREALIEAAVEIKQVHIGKNNKELLIPELLRRGLYSRFPAQVEQVARKKTVAKVKKRSTQATALPTDREEGALAVDEDEKAKQDVAKIVQRARARG